MNCGHHGYLVGGLRSQAQSCVGGGEEEGNVGIRGLTPPCLSDLGEEWSDSNAVRSNTIFTPLSRESIIVDSWCLNVLWLVILFLMLEWRDDTGRNNQVMVREEEGVLELALVFKKGLCTFSSIQEKIKIRVTCTSTTEVVISGVVYLDFDKLQPTDHC